MRVVHTGASGQLGAYLLERLVREGHEISAWSGTHPGSRAGVALKPVEITHFDRVTRELDATDPAVVIHTAAISSAESVRRDPIRGRNVNVVATGHLAEWCSRHGRRLIFTSTDMVFDGSKSWWNESDIAPRSSGEEDSLSLETFRRNPADTQSRPVEPGRQPEASLAWGGATLTAKRGQQDQKPCD